MADVRSFKPQLSSSRMFKYVKGESKDFDDPKLFFLSNTYLP